MTDHPIAHPDRLGALLSEARAERNWTYEDLATELGLDAAEVEAIEAGDANVTWELLGRMGAVVSLTGTRPATETSSLTQNVRIKGGCRLSGEIEVRTSKNAAVATLVGALLNRGTTILRNLARIEEVNRIIEVLNSIGVTTEWLEGSNDLRIQRPEVLDLASMDETAAQRTRTILLFLGPLLHDFENFSLPHPGGCDLGKRTVEPHLSALHRFGLDVEATHGDYIVTVAANVHPEKPIVLIERGDMVTENVLLAAARHPKTTVIRNASPNYMVQDLCFLLQTFGVQIEGVGTTTLTVTGVDEIRGDFEYSPSEDPIEAMSLLAAAVVTQSNLLIKRVPIEFMEIELAILDEMGMKFEVSEEYLSANGRTRLVDLRTLPGPLVAPRDKIHPLPFPGLNIDNLPFFAIIAACAEGRTLIHDWIYENRAIYLTELTRIGARVQLMDPHRVMIEGPTKWRAADLVCPPALRPGAVILIGMMAAPAGTTSILRNVYVIQRGYEDLAQRLNAVGANIEMFVG